MKIPLRTLLIILLIAPTVCFARPIQDVLKNAQRREKVLVEGTVKKAFDFDTFLVTDDSGEIAVSFLGVKQHVGTGDAVVAYGLFDGRASYVSRYGLINALDWAPAADPKALDLKTKYDLTPSPSPTPASSTPATTPNAPTRSVESRLRELDELKGKGLVSPDEYKEQRKRILGEL